jgi:Uma2 family endonuclease
MVAVPEAIMGRKLTLEDYCALPDDQDYEIVNGVLHVSPRPRPRHQQIAGELLFLLMLEQKRGAGTVVPDADLIVDERNTYVSPDLMFYAGDRYATVDPNEMLRLIPDLIVEVLSPSTSDYDRTTKRDVYAGIGVAHYWAVDGDRRAVTEHVLQADGTYHTRTVRAPEVFRPALFPHLEINLTQVLA